jgi:GTP cyclohydrolase II
MLRSTIRFTDSMRSVVRYAQAVVPTRFGELSFLVYRIDGDPQEHVAVVAGPVDALRQGERVLCRVHSECLTSEVLGSLKCDCREQLEAALQAIAEAGRGVVVYLRQEGRGIGLGNKIRAYALQAQGADTVEANLELGFEADLRRYETAAAVLADLGVASVALMTNNPQKISGLTEAGVKVDERIAHWVGEREESRTYLEVKKAKLGHL